MITMLKPLGFKSDALFTLVVSIVFALISGIQMFIDWDNIGIMISKIKLLYY